MASDADADHRASDVAAIRPLLDEIKTLCDTMRDVHDTCVGVHGRLSALMKAWTDEGDCQVDAQVFAQYTTIVRGFRRFLQSYRRKNVIKRLVGLQHLDMYMKCVHDDVERLCRDFHLPVVDENEWKKQWESDRETLQVRMGGIASNTVELMKELPSVQAQQEALTILKYELEDRSRKEQDDALVSLYTKAFQRLARSSEASVQTIPDWFVHEGSIEIDAEPFDQGSFGAVHRCKWRLTWVVVKRLLVDDGNIPPKVMTSFLNEANTWYRLRHPNVILMLGACHVSRPPFMVCEEATNGNLSDYLVDPRNTAHTWELLFQAAQGLAYLHSERIVHGDLKCNNILVARDGVAKLADFGFAYIRSYSSSTYTVSTNTKQKKRAGACRWRAPECFQGRSPTFASDVYSFGMCILEAVSQKVPWGFLGDDDVRFMVTRNDAIPARPDDCELLSDAAWDLIVYMTQSDPVIRPNMSEVVHRLESFVQASCESNMFNLPIVTILQHKDNDIKTVESQQTSESVNDSVVRALGVEND